MKTGNQLMPQPKEHADHRGWIETILRYIPGFRGYLEKGYRRESDDLQRSWLVNQLRRSKRGLDNYSRDLAEAGAIHELPLVDRLRGRLDKLTGRIDGAMPGYSGFFDFVQIRESELDRIYEYDVSLIESVEGLANSVEALAGNQEAPSVATPAILRQIEVVEQAWDRREDILKGLE